MVHLERIYTVRALRIILQEEAGYSAECQVRAPYQVLSEAVRQGRRKMERPAQAPVELDMDDFISMLMQSSDDFRELSNRESQLARTNTLVFAWDVSFSVRLEALSRFALSLMGIGEERRGDPAESLKVFHQTTTEWGRRVLIGRPTGKADELVRVGHVIRDVREKTRDRGHAILDGIFLSESRQ